MKTHLIFALILIWGLAPAGAQRAGDQTPAVDEIVSNMLARDRVREWVSGGYTGSREYVLENRLFNKRAEMLVNVSCASNGVKHFDVVSEDGWKSANRRVLRQMVDTEAANSQPDARPKSRITPENYTFRLVDTGPLEGRTAYIIQAVPKRQDKTLFRGRIWVDAEDYALVRVVGEPAKNPSFWTRKVEFVQDYQKAGPFWFPLQTTSITDARVFGRTEVRIRYFDYKPVGATQSAPVDTTRLEAQYANRGQAIKDWYNGSPLPGTHITWIENPDYRKDNGISVLCAKNAVHEPFLLLMSDHIFEVETARKLLRQPLSKEEVLLATDRNISGVFDIDDATKVRIEEDRIVEIGKALCQYDALDTGMFLCGEALFGWLEKAAVGGNCSLSDGLRLMAREGNFKSFDIGDAHWHDVDTPAALENAQRLFRTAATSLPGTLRIEYAA